MVKNPEKFINILMSNMFFLINQRFLDYYLYTLYNMYYTDRQIFNLA